VENADNLLEYGMVGAYWWIKGLWLDGGQQGTYTHMSSNMAIDGKLEGKLDSDKPILLLHLYPTAHWGFYVSTCNVW